MVEEGNGPVAICIQLALPSGSVLEDAFTVTIEVESGTLAGIKHSTNVRYT